VGVVLGDRALALRDCTDIEVIIEAKMS